MSGQGDAIGSAEPVQTRTATTEEIVVGLQRLRAEAGAPSYAEIVLRIGRLRESQGVSAGVAQPSRSTVYDAFRMGRTRVDAKLVGEIAQALTGDPAIGAAWRARAAAARATSPRPSTANAAAVPESAPPRWWVGLVIAVVCAVGNLVLYQAIHLLFGDAFPLYVDMIGTAIAAIVAGPWWGALAGVLMNVVSTTLQITVLHHGTDAGFAFVVVQIVGALVWGYGVRRWRLAADLPRYLLLNVVVAVACTIVAVPINAVLYTAPAGFSATTMQAALEQTGLGFLPALISTNMLLSLTDKLIAGLIALVVIGTLLRRWAPRDLVALIEPFRGPERRGGAGQRANP